MTAPTFHLSFLPDVTADGDRWCPDSRPAQVLAVGRYADCARAWRGQLPPHLRRTWGDPRSAGRLSGRWRMVSTLHLPEWGTLSLNRGDVEPRSPEVAERA